MSDNQRPMLIKALKVKIDTHLYSNGCHGLTIIRVHKYCSVISVIGFI